MDATLISRKRSNRSSSPPGALTRSRSQLFLHRNRSGHRRPDSGPRQGGLYAGLGGSSGNGEKREPSEEEDDTILIKDLRKKVKRDDGGDDLPRLLTKDLRARRVYSPQSSARASLDLIGDALPRGSDADSDFADRKIAGLGFGSPSSEEKSGVHVDDVMIAVNSDCADQGNADLGFGSSAEKDGLCEDDATMEVTESPDLGISSEARDFDRASTDSPDETVKLQDHKQFEEGNDGDCLEKINDFDEGIVLTTPPDPEIFVDSKVDEDEGRKEEDIRIRDAPFAGKAEENSGEGLSRKDSKRNDSVLKSKYVLGVRPRFQGKLFKAPGSVSYRKLFPYLMDIMGDGSGTQRLGHFDKEEKGMSGQDFQLPSSSQSQEPSEPELKSEGFTVREANGSELSSSQNLLESPMELNEKEVSGECLSVPSGDDKCFGESKCDPAADSDGVKDVGNALCIDEFKKCSIHKSNLDFAKVTNVSGFTSKHLDVLNDEFILTTPPDAKIYDNSTVTVDRSKSVPQDMECFKPMDLRTSPQENVSEGVCLKADKRKDSPLKTKSVRRPHLHGKLFKTLGSVSKRFLPFLMELAKDDPAISKFGHGTRKKDEVDMHVKRFELTLSSQTEEASLDGPKVEKSPIHDTVESNALENILSNPANESSNGLLPKLTSSQDLPELAVQSDANKVVHECLSAPFVEQPIEKAVIGSKDERSSESSFDLCSAMVYFHSSKVVANVGHDDDIKQMQDNISRPQESGPSHKNQNMLYVNIGVSNQTLEHHSTEEKGFSVNNGEEKQLLNMEKRKCVGRYPSEGQSLSQLDTVMLDLEENETSNGAISKSDDAVVLNHVSVSNAVPRSPPENILSKKQDMAAHGGNKEGSLQKGTAYGSKVNNVRDGSRAYEIENASEFKITKVLNRCPRIKSLKYAGSPTYKRLLPFLSNATKYSSLNRHDPKHQKFLDQTPLLPISDSALRASCRRDSNDSVTIEHYSANSGTKQQTEWNACELNNDSSSPRSQGPGFQSSNSKCKVMQMCDEQVLLNGICKPKSSSDTPIFVRRTDSPSTPLRPIVREVMASEEATLALSESLINSEVKGNCSFSISPDDKEKLSEAHGCCLSLSQLEVKEQLEVPAVDFKKGILKRNPRGCRGLCTCLNCASFRLHAERAFEFSRNQLLDAEEVAQDLLNELSRLRDMLGRPHDSVNNPVSDGDQLKEACKKAYAAEQLAKERLRVMKDDLNVHCRITNLQRPRVRFADHVQEKVIKGRR